jgi:hypothetical protein
MEIACAPFPLLPTKEQHLKIRNGYITSVCQSSNVIEAQYLPASALRENDKMGMIGRTLNEFDAGKVFPVAHGLFE